MSGILDRAIGQWLGIEAPVYPDHAKQKAWPPLASMPAKEIADKLDAAGMQRENCQFYYSELHDDFDTKMAFSHTLGIIRLEVAGGSTERFGRAGEEGGLPAWLSQPRGRVCED